MGKLFLSNLRSNQIGSELIIIVVMATEDMNISMNGHREAENNVNRFSWLNFESLTPSL